MTRRTTSSKGAVSLPLTYVYAVLIGIVVFIVATRVVTVQSAQATDENEQLLLSYFDSVIDGFASDPNVIQNVSLGRIPLRLEWTDSGSIRIGSSSRALRVSTFSERELDASTLTAWTYPYELGVASSPLLYLLDGSIAYRFVGAEASEKSALASELPSGAADFGLSIDTSLVDATQDADTIELCVNKPDSGWDGCEIQYVTDRIPYGYLSWDGSRWYPVVTYGSVYAALFAADEAAWNSTIVKAQRRNAIARQVLYDRSVAIAAELAPTCDAEYGAIQGNLTNINETITTGLDRLEGSASAGPFDLGPFEAIAGNLTTIEAIDTRIYRNGCPEVLG